MNRYLEQIGFLIFCNFWVPLALLGESFIRWESPIVCFMESQEGYRTFILICLFMTPFAFMGHSLKHKKHKRGEV
jgi:hypothetical protein